MLARDLVVAADLVAVAQAQVVAPHQVQHRGQDAPVHAGVVLARHGHEPATAGLEPQPAHAPGRAVVDRLAAHVELVQDLGPDAVPARSADHAVGLAVAHDHAVVAAPAVRGVGAVAAVDRVVALAAVDLVVAVAAADDRRHRRVQRQRVVLVAERHVGARDGRGGAGDRTRVQRRQALRPGHRRGAVVPDRGARPAAPRVISIALPSPGAAVTRSVLPAVETVAAEAAGASAADGGPGQGEQDPPRSPPVSTGERRPHRPSCLPRISFMTSSVPPPIGPRRRSRATRSISYSTM